MADESANELIEFDTSEELREIALKMVQNCVRSLDIVSRHLDPAIYDHEQFVDAVKQIALNSQHARVRILVTDIGPVVSRGHRLLELNSRLSTYISIRKPGRDHKNFNEAILVADNRGYIHRRFADRYEGRASYDDQRTARDLTVRFEEIWERADTDPNFRRLHL